MEAMMGGIDEQLLAQLQGVDISKLPQRLSTPQGFHAQFGDFVGGNSEISDAILNHLQNNMGLNVDAVSMDELIQVVQEQVDQLAMQTEALLSKFKRTQAGLAKAADTLAGVGSPDMGMGMEGMAPGMEGGMPPPDMGGGMPPPEGMPPDMGGGMPPPDMGGGMPPPDVGMPPPPVEGEPPPPDEEAPPPEEPPPEDEEEKEDEDTEVSDAGLKEVEGTVEEMAEEGDMSEEEYQKLMECIAVLKYIQENHGMSEESPAEEAIEEAAEETPAEESGGLPSGDTEETKSDGLPGETDFDGENLSALMAGISKHY